jgi:serine/threonine-protein kinase
MADLLERLRAALADRYAVERELGSGGMAVVFLAQDRRHGRLVAVKVLRPELAQSLAAERFLREISIAARLTHPNILTLIDSGEAGGLLYYIMPFVDGESLRSRLARERQLPLEESLRIVREVGDALSYAHSLGVVHRDIKPENILGASGRPVVADFGIAQAVSGAGGARLTESGLAVGTPSYMSPEQATGAEQVDSRSDIYSLACMLYEMLAGLPPYSGATPQAILARKVTEPVPGLRVVRDAVPPVVEASIMKALAKVPADRFATVSGFLDALAGRGFTPPPLPAARRRRLVLLAAGGGLTLLAGGYALLGRWSGDAEPVRATFTQVTSAPGVEWFPSLSPDGRWLVYSGEGSGNRDIYLQSVGAENAINITKDSPDDDDQPAFSPDGERIAFRSERDGGGIFVMGRTGDAVRRVTRRGFHPAWSPDGAALAFADEKIELNPQNANVTSALWVVTLATGELRQAFAGDAVTPSWSPHGLRIAYTHRLSLAVDRGVWTVPAGGGAPVAVTRDVARLEPGLVP